MITGLFLIISSWIVDIPLWYSIILTVLGSLLFLIGSFYLIYNIREYNTFKNLWKVNILVKSTKADGWL